MAVAIFNEPLVAELQQASSSLDAATRYARDRGREKMAHCLERMWVAIQEMIEDTE